MQTYDGTHTTTGILMRIEINKQQQTNVLQIVTRLRPHYHIEGIRKVYGPDINAQLARFALQPGASQLENLLLALW